MWVVRFTTRVMVGITARATVQHNARKRGAVQMLVFRKRVLNVGLDLDSTLAGGFNLEYCKYLPKVQQNSLFVSSFQ